MKCKDQKGNNNPRIVLTLPTRLVHNWSLHTTGPYTSEQTRTVTPAFLTSAAASGSNGPFARFRRPHPLERRPHPHADPAAEGSGRERSSSHTDNAFRRLRNASSVAALPAAGVTSGRARSVWIYGGEAEILQGRGELSSEAYGMSPEGKEGGG